VRDGANCFNLNSLVTETEGRYSPNSIGQEQMVSLMVVLGINENAARPVAAAATDWADSDSIPSPGGAEDDAYQTAATPYRTANRLFAHPSELRAVKGVSPALYAKLRGWSCELPEAKLPPRQVNTTLPDQHPLLATPSRRWPR